MELKTDVEIPAPSDITQIMSDCGATSPLQPQKPREYFSRGEIEKIPAPGGSHISQILGMCVRGTGVEPRVLERGSTALRNLMFERARTSARKN